MKKYNAVLVLILALFLFNSCKENSSGPPFGFTVFHTDCKQAVLESKNNGCLVYSCDRIGNISIHHINAGFNCCPDDFDVPVSVSGSSIIIDETGVDGNCYCECLYDLSFTLTGLKPGKYTVIVKEPLLPAGDTALVLDIDVPTQKYAEKCAGRSAYPWITK